MNDRAARASTTGRRNAGRGYLLRSWYGLISLVGFGFGLLADRRPFGEEIFVHPLVMFFIVVGLSLIALRVLLARPVPEVISDRALIAGCVAGLATFLAGNFVSARLLPLG